MAHYIDAERLRAEIENLRRIQRAIGDSAINLSMRRFFEGTEDMCNRFLPLIDSLQQEKQEVDLNEEVKRYYSENFEYLSSDSPTLSILTNIARHFAEWGEKNAYKAIMKKAASDLVDAVERYVSPQKGQFCHRSELLILKDKLKNLINN